MVSQDAPYPRTARYLGVLEALAGLPVDIQFISFEDVKNGCLSDFDVVINGGDGGTSFSGDVCWKDPVLLEKIRTYIAEGGGFIGVGEPSAVQYGGRYFQLADAMGVDKEMGFSIAQRRHNVQIQKEHFITEDLTDEVDYADGVNDVFAKEGIQILDASYQDKLWRGMDNCHVKMAVNDYGKGRCFYLAGMRYDAQNTRLLYRAMLWCASKEGCLKKVFSSNIYTECHYYQKSKKYALVNNTNEEQKTVFFDKNGASREYVLGANEIVWIDG